MGMADGGVRWEWLGRGRSVGGGSERGVHCQKASGFICADAKKAINRTQSYTVFTQSFTEKENPPTAFSGLIVPASMARSGRGRRVTLAGWGDSTGRDTVFA
jgi:hypothetical protein